MHDRTGSGFRRKIEQGMAGLRRRDLRTPIVDPPETPDTQAMPFFKMFSVIQHFNSLGEDIFLIDQMDVW